MKPLASFIMQGRLRAATATAGFGVAGLLLPPLALVSSSAVSLVTLRLGAAQGVAVAALAALVLALIAWVAGLHPAVGMITALVQWLPALVLAEVLRRTFSWAITLAVGIGIGCGVILLLHATVPNLPQMWLAVLEQAVGPLFEQSGVTGSEREQAFLQAASLMTGMLAAVSLLALSAALILARYWQAVLYNPGGFREEFHALSLGRVPAMMLVGLLLVAWLADSYLLFELSLVFLMAFFLHGLAVIHGTNARMNLSRIWLVFTYVLLALALPQMVILLATLGVMDSFLNLRGRLTRAQPEDKSDDT
ncbi:DUF2232 domain-containing protein [Ectothiorhodospira sp. BSL-9]|uniref:DUF2232 domain-containing protein n=1 Tax=Ectothiorhodospira sp. BSL-9 TaxID=1442136 RepID=UPI0007B42EF8|nr:DUF2232 domain-containing protein [Ectothiorhodospira sp. BSL-9]ANB02514.1 hypothetical protein ECTOBSL9_1931 [Ectothiorhodospira sp. BSL-9]TVQ73603.1 MAG: DUF2232 domain-containing protein [Chromatiaceae bacterium]